MQTMRGYGGKRWVDPYDYKRRSRSLDHESENDGRGGPLVIVDDGGDPPGTTELVSRGLFLAGRGLKGDGGVERLMGKNYSTSEIEVRKFDPRNPPADGSVEEEFQVLLRDKTYFWGEARKNLPNFSREKKWSLICSFRSKESPNCSSESLTGPLTQSQLLHNLDQSLRAPAKLSKTLHQLEKALRQSSFAQAFLAQNGIASLFRCSSDIKVADQYVYLRCFKTLMNYDQARIEILNSPELLNYFCELLVDDATRLSCKLVPAETLLLLTYVDEENGYEKVLNSVSCHVKEWLECIERVLTSNTSEQDEPFYARIKVGKNKNNFVMTSLFLINSIGQALGIKDQTVLFLKTLKEHKIHHCFHLMKQLQSSEIDKQIGIYLELEKKIAESCFPKGQLEDNIYEPALQQLIRVTTGTLIEQDLSCLINSFNQIVNSRTTAESIKIFKSLGSILDYLIDNFCTDVPSQPATLVQESINKFLDKLESDEVARRAMNEMTELEKTITSLRKQLSELQELADTSKEKLVEELKHVKTINDTKETEIQELSKKLEETKELRRNGEKRLEHALSHRISDDTRKKSHSIFDNLKTKSGYKRAKPKRVRSILKSQRIQSLSSYVQSSVEADDPSCNNENSPDESAEMSDSSLPTSFEHTSQNPDSVETIRELSPELRDELFKRCSQKKPHPGIPMSDLTASPELGQPPLRQPSETVKWKTSSTEKDGSVAGVNSDVPLLPPPPPPPPPPPFPETIIKSTSQLNSDQSTTTPSNNHVLPPPPPPPPLPVAFLASETSKPQHKEPMKQIHWEKLNEIAETLWEDQDQKNETFRELEQSGIFSQIENSFKVKDRAPKPIAKTVSEEKANTKSFLPRDLAHQFGINLHMFSQYSSDEFVLKVLQCDNEVLQNSTALEFFMREDLVKIPASLRKSFEPYSSNYLQDRPPSKDPAELDRPDRIFLDLCYNLRSYWYERSLCLLTLTTYERDYYDLIYRLQKIDDVIQRLKHGYRFKNFLFIIVEIGNYMNKRPAGGIRLSSLNKLAFVKSSADKSFSFLHFIERLIRVKYPDLYGFTDEIARVEDLGKVSLDHLELECNDFRTKIATVVGFIKEGKLSHPERLHPQDLVLKKMTYKVNRAQKKADLLQDQLRLIRNDLKKLMRYYGEDFDNSESKNDFFQILIEFSQTFRKCAKENADREECERVYEQRKSMIETHQRSVSNNNSKSQEEDDAVDILLAKLRGADKSTTLVRRRRSARYADIASQENGSSQKPRPTHAGASAVLLERTHAMLEDIHNI